MWRPLIMLGLTLVNCAAIPKAGSQQELQRLVRLPRIEFSTPLHFDRASGFVVFPSESAAAAEAAALLKDAKGTPKDGPLLLEAARLHAAARDAAPAIRYYARAADLFGRWAAQEPESTTALTGLADALAALGRFAEAQAALDRAAQSGRDRAAVAFAFARFHKEKAWASFTGDENRFGARSVPETLEWLIRAGAGARIEAAQRELREAGERFEAAAELEDQGEFLRQRAAFRSLRAAMEAAFVQTQSRDRSPRDLQRALFAPEAAADLNRAADRADAPPAVIAAAMFAAALDELSAHSLGALEGWPHLSARARDQVLARGRRLQEIAEAGGKDAAEALEWLGCAQVYLVKDLPGGERSLRAALRLDPGRERSWDLLVLALSQNSAPSRLVEVCESRSAALAGARSSAMLIKAYERLGDDSRAEWTALQAATAYPNDFYVNLSLAALFLKRPEFRALLGRAGDALNKAEKQLGPGGSRQNRLDFVVLKSLYLALSGQPQQARSLLEPYAAPGRGSPEIQEILRALDT